MLSLIGIGYSVIKHGHKVVFCGHSGNQDLFSKRNLDYRSFELFEIRNSNTNAEIDFGYWDVRILEGLANGSLDDLISEIQPNLIIIPYYISYLLPFLVVRYPQIGYCCVNILLRGELFTPHYLFNFHYERLHMQEKHRVDQIFTAHGSQPDDFVRETFDGFNEFILCPKEFDLSNKYIGQNVEYSEAITGYLSPQSQEISKENLILFSMGTNNHLFPLTLNKLVEVFVECAQMMKENGYDYRWLFSITEGVLEQELEILCSKNGIEIVHWFDQAELLKKAKIMISHAGIGSLKECIYTGTPMLCFPLMRDQPYNAKRIQSLEIGISLDPFKITAKKVQESILSLLNDYRYVYNIEYYRKLICRYRQSSTLYHQLMKVATNCH